MDPPPGPTHQWLDSANLKVAIGRLGCTITITISISSIGRGISPVSTSEGNEGHSARAHPFTKARNITVASMQGYNLLVLPVVTSQFWSRV